MREPKHFIFAGLVLAVAGFLLMEEYEERWGLVYNVMNGRTLGIIPYRLVLLCSLALLGWGLYRHWTPKNK